ncbi:MAG: LPS export ABC transporter permease LptF [Methylococcaceae bacterium]|nr:LPS export ABC transporter permease LptF [Methylococcaceae bacterium]
MTTYDARNLPRRSPVLFTVLARLISFDLARTFLAVLTVLLLILMSKQFAQLLSQAFDGQISNETIFLLFGFKFIDVAVQLLPSALFAAVLIVFGRMYRDNEMSALGSGGVGFLALYKYILGLVVPLALIGSLMSLELNPWAMKQTAMVLLNEKENADVRLLVEGRFNEYSRGDIVFYAEKISPDHQMKNIFVQERKDNKLSIVMSRKGFVRIVDDVRFIVLVDGQRYRGEQGKADYEITEFEEYAVAVGETSNSALEMTRDAMPSGDLWLSSDPQEVTELHKRLSIPIGMIVLAILAVPLSAAAPRSGVYGNILLAFLVYLLYKNLLSIAQSWLIKETVPLQMGYWWVYAAMLGVGLILTIRNLGFRWCGIVLSGQSRRLATFGDRSGTAR